MAATDDPRGVFEAMFAAVRDYIITEGVTAAAQTRVATNPKGEATRAFDAEAERIALAVASREFGSIRMFSEEIGEVVIGTNPQWTLVLDPCDGSNNLRRGIRSVGFAVAALPINAPLDPALVEYALCGDIFTGSLYSAARGAGATLDGKPCQASAQTEVRHAVVGANIGRERSTRQQSQEDEQADAESRAGLPHAIRLLSQASTTRRTGATVLDLCYVAQGAYDAYVDLRWRLTPENFLAPALVLTEAGGRLTDPRGSLLGPVEFTQPYSIVAAGNDMLLAHILDIVRA